MSRQVGLTLNISSKSSLSIINYIAWLTIFYHIPLSLRNASYHPQNKLFFVHSLSPWRTNTTLNVPLIFQLMRKLHQLGWTLKEITRTELSAWVECCCYWLTQRFILHFKSSSKRPEFDNNKRTLILFDELPLTI